MGEVINVRCKACKKEWQCFTGNGLLHGRKETVLAAFSEEDWQEAANLLGEGPFPLYDFQYRLAVCGHCHNIVTVPVLQMVDSGEQVTGRCPLCGQKAENLCGEEQNAKEWSEKTACPVCRSRRLDAEEAGHWD